MSNQTEQQPQNDNNPPDPIEKLVATVLARGAAADIVLTQGLREDLDRLSVSTEARDAILQRAAGTSFAISALEHDVIQQTREMPLITPKTAGELMGLLEDHAAAFERQARTPEQVKQVLLFRQTLGTLGRLLPARPTQPNPVPRLAAKDFISFRPVDPKKRANDPTPGGPTRPRGASR